MATKLRCPSCRRVLSSVYDGNSRLSQGKYDVIETPYVTLIKCLKCKYTSPTGDWTTYNEVFQYLLPKEFKTPVSVFAIRRGVYNSMDSYLPTDNMEVVKSIENFKPTLIKNTVTIPLAKFGACSLVGLFANEMIGSSDKHQNCYSLIEQFADKFDGKLNLVLPILVRKSKIKLIPFRLIKNLGLVCDDVDFFKERYHIEVSIEFRFIEY